jgi:hypothetical protein
VTLHAISPRYQLDKIASGKLDDLVDVYDDQMRGWLLQPVALLRGHQHAGFAMLSILLTYFEPLGNFLAGQESGSGVRFREGVRSVFRGDALPQPDEAEMWDELYFQVRGGMFHRGLTKSKVLVVPHGDSVLGFQKGSDGKIATVIVNPWGLHDAIERHHGEYVSQLRDPAQGDVRKRFAAWFDLRIR